MSHPSTPLAIRYNRLDQHLSETLEAQIRFLKSGGIGIGRALREVVKLGHYKMYHESFNDYCNASWGYQRVQVESFLLAANTVDDILAELHHALIDNLALIHQLEGWGNVKAACELAKAPADKRLDILRKAFEKPRPAGPNHSDIRNAASIVLRYTNREYVNEVTKRKHEAVLTMERIAHHIKKSDKPIDKRMVASELKSIGGSFMQRKSAKYKNARAQAFTSGSLY